MNIEVFISSAFLTTMALQLCILSCDRCDNCNIDIEASLNFFLVYTILPLSIMNYLLITTPQISGIKTFEI